MALPTRLLATFTALLLHLPAFAAPPASAPPTTQPTLRFLTAAQTNQALLDNADGYLDSLQPLEMSAKTRDPITGADLSAQRQEFRRRYGKGGLDFSADEQTELAAAVAALRALLSADFPRFAAQPFSFAKVTPAVESGLPHTRGDHIVLSQPYLDGTLRALSRRGNRDQARLLMLCPLLAHEQLHVLQRRHPDLFAGLYERWGFIHAKGIASCPWLDARQVANPDGVDLNWVFAYREGPTQRYLWPRIILDADPQDAATRVPRMPDDFRLLAIDLAPAGKPDTFKVVTGPDGRPTSRDLQQVQEYIDAVQGSRYSFHPHEAAAELFQHLFVRGYVVARDRGTPLSPTDQHVQAAFRELLK